MEENIAQSHDWLAITKVFLAPIVTILVAWIFGYLLAFKSWKKQKAIDTRLAYERIQFDTKAASCKALWSLMAFISEKENINTVFVNRGTGENASYLLRVEQARKFFTELQKVFYEQGHGIYIPDELREDIFDFRNRIYKILDSQRYEEGGLAASEQILIKNPSMQRVVKNLRDRLTTTLRQQINDHPELNAS